MRLASLGAVRVPEDLRQGQAVYPRGGPVPHLLRGEVRPRAVGGHQAGNPQEGRGERANERKWLHPDGYIHYFANPPNSFGSLADSIALLPAASICLSVVTAGFVISDLSVGIERGLMTDNFRGPPRQSFAEYCR